MTTEEPSPERTVPGTDDREAQVFFSGKARTVVLPAISDRRGTLTPLDFLALPFVPQRAFVIGDVPVGTVRGGHAHKRGRQLLLCLAGRISVRLVSQGAEETVLLERAQCGLLVEAEVWSEQTYLEEGAILCVLSSEAYDPHNYIRSPSGE